VPMDASLDGVMAAREAWVCCDAVECGKWRRVPAMVAKLIGDTDQWYGLKHTARHVIGVEPYCSPRHRG